MISIEKQLETFILLAEEDQYIDHLFSVEEEAEGIHVVGRTWFDLAVFLAATAFTGTASFDNGSTFEYEDGELILDADAENYINNNFFQVEEQQIPELPENMAKSKLLFFIDQWDQGTAHLVSVLNRFCRGERP